MRVDWTWKAFGELTLDELYELLALRAEVFVVEQRSLYQDVDGYDRKALHLLARAPGARGPQLVAYLRAFPPGAKFPEASLGRVVTAPAARREGLGRELVRRGLALLDERWPGAGCRIGAQAYLVRFYEGFGFRTVGDVYDEDGIPHVDMVRAPLS